MALSKTALQSTRYMIICLVGILGFGMLAIFPSSRAIVATDRKIAALQEKIDEQKALYPLFQDLLKRSETELPSRLPFPEKTKLPREDTGDISDFFQDLALKNDFTVESIVPDMVSLTDGSGHLMLDVKLTGMFMNFRRLLLQLEEMPYLEHIETITIQTVGDAKEIRLKLWIAQQ